MREKRVAVVAVLVSIAGCARGPSPSPSPSPSAAPTPASSPSVAAGPAAEANRPLPQPLPDLAARVNGHAISTKTLSALVEPGLQSGNIRSEEHTSELQSRFDLV